MSRTPVTWSSQSKDTDASTAVPEEVIDALRGMRSPVMITHVVPDPDALGTMLGMARAWTADGCSPSVALPPDSLSQRLTFLFEWTNSPVAASSDFESADGFVVLDTAKKSRCNICPEIKAGDWSAGRPIVNIDHHASNTLFGDFNWVVPGAGSTSEQVYYLLRAANRPVDSITASLLFAGIQTDTLGFTLPTTTAPALQAAAELVRAGARIAELGECLHRSQRRSEFDLLRVIYANTRLVDGGQIAYSQASHDEIHGAGCTAADIDDQINIPRSLAGVRLAMLFTEGIRGKTRINFRSSGEVTVVELSAEFNGGGHAQAAGAVLDCALAEAVDKVVPRAVEHLKRFDRG